MYRIDTEMNSTCFKMSFIIQCKLFLTKCLCHEKYGLLTTLFESIFQLDGNAFVDSEKMVIELMMNSKKKRS